MTKFEIEISSTAEKQIRKLPREEQIRVFKAIRALGSEPRPRGSRKLRGYRDVFRIRVGVYRVLYSIEKARLLVIILKIGHRRNAYR